MVSKIACALPLLALVGLAASKPLDARQELDVRQNMAFTEGLEVREPAPITQDLVPRAGLGVGEIIDVADQIVNLIKDIFDFISDIDDRQHAAETNFTQSMVGTLAAQYPDKNVILFHNQKCKTNFQNGVHAHYELDIGLGMTQGYEAFVFDSGSFDLVGDGGYINWCFQGNWNRKGNHVDFAQIGQPAPTKRSTRAHARALASGNVPSLTFDFATKHNSTNGKSISHTALHSPVTYQPAPAPQQPLLPPQQPTSGKNDGNDGHYFVQCKSKGNGTVSQGVAYYKDLIPGKNVGQQPDGFEWISKVWAKNDSSISTPGSNHDEWTVPVGAVTFDETKSSVHWQIFGNAIADTVAVNQTCGVADDGKDHFWVYKDAGELLYSTAQYDCESLYYAY